MGSDRDGEQTGSFPSTDWSLIEHAASDEVPSVQRLSMEELLHRYHPPLRRYLTQSRSGIDSNQIDDWLQGFITTRLIERRLLERADRARGKFRSLLITSLDRFVIDAMRRDGARAARQGVVAARGNSNPSHTLDLAWAEQVMNEALERTRLRCEQTNRAAIWALFHRRMLDTNEKSSGYKQLAVEFGFQTPVQASTALYTARRIFARKLRDVLMEYAGADADIAEEIRDLKNIFENSRAEK